MPTVRIFDIQIFPDGTVIAIIPDRSSDTGGDEAEYFEEPKGVESYAEKLEDALGWFEEKGWQIVSIIPRESPENEESKEFLVYYHVIVRKRPVP